jgi:hypothetical protein
MVVGHKLGDSLSRNSLSRLLLYIHCSKQFLQHTRLFSAFFINHYYKQSTFVIRLLSTGINNLYYNKQSTFINRLLYTGIINLYYKQSTFVIRLLPTRLTARSYLPYFTFCAHTVFGALHTLDTILV